MTWSLADRIELSEPSDPMRDYCQWPYEAPVPAPPGALRSSALLYQSFAIAGQSEKMLAFTDAIAAAAGAFNTVFGVKFAEGRLSWEFYFYDYARTKRRFGTEDFLAAARPHLTVTAPAADDRPYFMFSIEVDERHIDGGEPLDQIDLYIGSPGSEVSTGICYGLTQLGLEMRNIYFFFDAIRHAQDIREKLVENAHVPWSALRLPELLWPEMDARTIVVANKRRNDGIYFSRIGVDALIAFLERLSFPAEIVAFARANRTPLSHHLFDVGYDFSVDPSGQGIIPLKGSYYGLL